MPRSHKICNKTINISIYSVFKVLGVFFFLENDFDCSQWPIGTSLYESFALFKLDTVLMSCVTRVF